MDVSKVTYNRVVIAHAVLSCLAWALFYPIGAITIRLFLRRKIVFVHAGWMVFTYTMVLASMGMGLWMAIVSDQVNTYHAIIGLVVVGSLLLQPVTGLIHHRIFKKKHHSSIATFIHVWWGRAVITLGIINGGFGLQLTGNGDSMKGEIAYGVVAGVVWLIWMIVIVVAYLRKPKVEHEESGLKAARVQNTTATGSGEFVKPERHESSSSDRTVVAQ